MSKTEMRRYAQHCTIVYLACGKVIHRLPPGRARGHLHPTLFNLDGAPARLRRIP